MGGKVVVNRAMSLDGFVAGPDDAQDWIFDFMGNDAPWQKESAAATGAMLVGRRTVEVGSRREAKQERGTESTAKATRSQDRRSSSPIGRRTRRTRMSHTPAVTLRKLSPRHWTPPVARTSRSSARTSPASACDGVSSTRLWWLSCRCCSATASDFCPRVSVGQTWNRSAACDRATRLSSASASASSPTRPSDSAGSVREWHFPSAVIAARARVRVRAMCPYRSADMRHTGSVSNAFVQSMEHNFEQALRLMETALTDCLPASCGRRTCGRRRRLPAPHGGLHGSAPWFLGYHALNTLDYDLAGEFEPWAPPQPFDDNTYGFPNRRFTKPELLGYVEWCRGRVRQTLGGLTEEMAARPLPSAHRYHGLLFAKIVGSRPLHVVEHAFQIRQFLTAAGLTVQPMPGDRGYMG
jgi:hypothetical protein